VGKKRSEASVEKVRVALKGRKRPDVSERMKGEGNPFFGKTHSKETLDRLSAKRRGSKLSPETKLRMCDAQRRRREKEALAKPPPSPPAPREPRLPFRHTPQTIENMRIAAKKRGISPVTRAANKAALTGRKRAPFAPETIARMRVAAKAREQVKRAAREGVA
jgi:hypothetical protein